MESVLIVRQWTTAQKITEKDIEEWGVNEFFEAENE